MVWQLLEVSAMLVMVLEQTASDDAEYLKRNIQLIQYLYVAAMDFRVQLKM